MNDTVTVAGISYTKPQVYLLQESDYCARACP